MAKIAFLLDTNFEDSEFRDPYDAVTKAGHTAVVLGLEKGKQVEGKKGTETVTIEEGPDAAQVADFDAVVIPGGFAPDKVRTDAALVGLVRDAVAADKPVAAICHAGWVLAEADVIRGKRVTSVGNIKTDLVNAGADWVDEEVVEDGSLITSRTPADLPAFNEAILRRLEQR
ncbi:MAG: DJ-1/PfpI/YhbO family deglycase/protease [Streptosporangiales bacterium]|nr:DJ-1/PfpI/YhbO family deglycase/protease [Streptosporangiales bacterium]